MNFIDGIQLAGAIIGILFVIFLAYWGTTWISKKYSAVSGGKHIQILDRAMLSQDKQLVLAKLNDKVYFLGVSAQHIDTIAVLEGDSIPEPAKAMVGADFGSIFKDTLQKQFPFLKGRDHKARYHKDKEDNR